MCYPNRRQILKKIVDTKTAMGENLRASAFALTEAKYAAGDFRHTVFDNVDQPTVKVRALRGEIPMSSGGTARAAVAHHDRPATRSGSNSLQRTLH